MSATSRSDVRDPRDFYRTPSWCVEAIADRLRPGGWHGMKALDVACGDGAIGAVLKGLGAEVTGVELDPELAAAAREKLDRVFNADFLADRSVADFGQVEAACGVRESHGLSSHEKAVVNALISRADGKGVAHPSINTIAKDTGLSRSTVKRVLAGLPQLNGRSPVIVKKEHRLSDSGEFDRNHYTLALKQGATAEETRFGHGDLMAADFDAVIMNPPYKQAMEFVQRARKLMGRRTVAALLRLSFLESQKRRAFWQENPADVYVLSRRPSFTAGGTDSAAYAWFVWSREPGGRLSIL